MLKNRVVPLTCALLLLAASLAAGEPPVASSLPDLVFAQTKTDPPLWVSARAAESPEGEIDWGVLGPTARSIYEGIRDGAPIAVRQPDGSFSAEGPVYDDSISGVRPDCIYYGPSWVDRYGPAPDSSVSDLIRHAKAVAEVEVERVHSGFFSGQPSSLLETKVQSWLRTAEGLGAQDFLFIPYPRAEFTVGDHSFCKGDPAADDLPAPGDRILVFAYRAPSDVDGFIVASPPSHLLLIDDENSYRSLGHVADETGFDLKMLRSVIETDSGGPQEESAEGATR